MNKDTRPGTPPGPDVSLAAIPLHSTNLLTVLDADGVIQYESPSIERVFGFDQDELVGDQVAAYFHPDDRERVIEAFERVVESEDYIAESAEYRHKCADGSYCWVESVVSANPTPEGYYVVNTRDIADRKAREEELERTNERLDEVARVVSHDLRNPLSVAKGHLDLAREEYDSESLEAVDNALDRMETLIEDMLTLARQGDQLSATTSVSVETIANRAWEVVDTGEATLSVESDVAFQADPDRLQQLFENLFRNAREHGGGDVTVRVGTLADRDGFYVADDGPGIPPDDREAVFRPSYSTVRSGSGYGLAIVDEIVDAHDWEIDVTDSWADGARFEVSDVDTSP